MIDIVIPVYTPAVPPVLEDCLRSVVQNTDIAGGYRLIMPSSPASQAKNLNRGLDVATSRYIAVLDWDVEVPPGWLAKLACILDNYPHVGVVGGALTPNDWYVSKPEGYVGPFPTLAAGCMLIRDIGLRFDERYPHGWFMDTDFCREYKRRGYDIWLDRTVVVPHHLTRSTSGEDHSVHRAMCEAVYRDKWGDIDV